jgi:starch-binding outer membrane protein, SusD/RagB family
MKKYIIILIISIVTGTQMTSCEDYLDRAPEAGLSGDDVFTNYNNLKAYFDWVYRANRDATGGVFYTSYLSMIAAGSLCLDAITDIADAGRVMWGLYHQGPGPLGDNNVHYGPRLEAMFRLIRICNMTLANIHRLTDGDQREIDDIIAQAYFVRGFAHLEVFKLWGPQPYITQVVGSDDPWDMPRLSAQQTMYNVAADMDTAIIFFKKAGKMRRDPGPGQPGHLAAHDQRLPNGVTAAAMKGRALLYGASKLHNGTQKNWEDAAIANWEAIEIAKEYQYAMLDYANYYDNYWGTTYSNEMLWGHYWGTYHWRQGNINKQMMVGILSGHRTDNSGICPTQNHVDMYETIWGDPLNTPEDRAAAEALGRYNEQDPFANRDPRLALNVVYNGAPIPGYGTAHIYYEVVNGETVWSEILDPGFAGRTRTGYFIRKIWGEKSVKNPIEVQHTCSMIRLGELYLNYAEAANEAYGPNIPAPGSAMTAVQALNRIRSRYPGLADVQPQFTASANAFRERVRNERNVELSFEQHYYFDIRRWMTAPERMSGPNIVGIIPEKVPVSAEYPTGFRYERRLLEDPDRQNVWFDAKYYMPFHSSVYYKMKAYEPGVPW